MSVYRLTIGVDQRLVEHWACGDCQIGVGAQRIPQCTRTTRASRMRLGNAVSSEPIAEGGTLSAAQRNAEQTNLRHD
jgi:hypothetical protein